MAQQQRQPPEPTHDPSSTRLPRRPATRSPEGVPGPGSTVGDAAKGIDSRPDRDPGDAVPEGVARPSRCR